MTVNRPAIANAHDGPNASHSATPAKPVAASTAGYRQEMGARHEAHRARRTSHDTTGTFCQARTGAWQRGHRDPGDTTLSPSGRRWMHTLRKLPRTSPMAPTSNDATGANGARAMTPET